MFILVFFFQAEDGIRDAQESRGLGDVYKRQIPSIPSWVVKTEVKPEATTIKNEDESAEQHNGGSQGVPCDVNLVHLSSALSKVAKLIGTTNAALQAALMELSAATITTSAPTCNNEEL
eukprot:TRINITY_DN44345_c0_g1_i1.p1 TRINITY_DN44345_c0_g1~~TRINITY_DN44345_c0_g1_i1.p1  ORF type:complete len:119 (-),score=33.33 TRINITY_DN44345_c0_g1_i1:68-424(-)